MSNDEKVEHVDILRDPISGVRPWLSDWIGSPKMKWTHMGFEFEFKLHEPRGGNARFTEADVIQAWNNYAMRVNELMPEPRDLK